MLDLKKRRSGNAKKQWVVHYQLLLLMADHNIDDSQGQKFAAYTSLSANLVKIIFTNNRKLSQSLSIICQIKVA